VVSSENDERKGMRRATSRDEAMRILFLSHYFPPEVNAPANRTHEHARCWVADGHEVTVITGVPNHPRGAIFPGYRNRLIQEEWIDGIRVIRTWTYVTPNEGFVRRTLNYLLFAVTAVLASARAGRPDVVVATSPQFFAGLAGAVVARLKRRPFVLEVRDLWPDSIVQLGQLRRGWIVRRLEWIERALYRSAAGIVVVTRAFAEHIAARGIPRERIAFVPNGIDPELFRPRAPGGAERALLRQHGLEGKFLVGYVGTLGLAHGLVTVIDAAERLRDVDDVAFLLIGDGADRSRLEAEIARRGLRNVHLLGLRPRAEIPSWLSVIDLTLVLLRDLPVFATVIPSKVFEFLAQERPMLLAAPRGEIRTLIEEAKAGFVIEPEDADALAEAVRLVRANPPEAAARARAGREWVERDYLRDVLARRMAAFLERMAGKKS
jgi:glycosyltransferase involved in cell wall biosynthesis